MFHTMEGQPVAVEGAASQSSTEMATALQDNSLDENHLTDSRPAPYDADQRSTHMLILDYHRFQEYPQPLRRNMSNSGLESLDLGKKSNGVHGEEDCKGGLPDSSKNALATKVGLTYLQASSEY